MWQLAIIPAVLILIIGTILFVTLGPAIAAWLHDLMKTVISTGKKIRKQWRNHG